MELDISSLPEEVLLHILQFLNIRHRLIASLVCKKWLHLINCNQLLCDIKIQFSTKVENTFKSFSHMTREFQWFSFHEIVIENSALEFLKKYSRQFVRLSFIDCATVHSKNESGFEDQIQNCDNLKFLEIRNSNVIHLFHSLPNVTTLIIHIPSGLTDYVISELNKSLFKLEVLSLGCYVSCEKVVWKRFYVNGETVETNPSDLILSFESVRSFIEKHSNTLKVLDISMLQLLPEAVLIISKIKGLKLKSILFASGLRSKYIQMFCENHSSLTSLDLSSSLYATNETICAVCKCLPNLQEFVIRYNHVIDSCIIEILQLQHLVKLDLSYSVKISELSYREAVSNLKVFKLKYLNLAFSEISDESLFELLRHNLNIRYLNVSRTSISNKTLNMICKNLMVLECLVLDSCKTISDSGLTGEFENYSDYLTPTPLSNLKNLTKLDLSRIPSITNDGCLKAIWFLRLRVLHLLECKSLILQNDIEIQLQKQNPCLRIFVISSLTKRYEKLNEMT
ncbi:f-box domain-containing protein [Trichonephila clavata]|uniref:F-box domain-containing protein n=1 Tax=Trichonephila clavata TaxID=2740835 RepID=A0A8X6LZ22_TRICU|nr:f-box domain-containing protein [Trichonephila clavata]